MTHLSTPSARGVGRSGWGPALALLALGAAVIALRPALPLDETRYLEVARELSWRDPLLLRLDGEPYADKPPLLFWIGAGLEGLGLPLWGGMRLVPAVATALTALLVARLGRRAGLASAGWMYAGMILPLGYTQILLVDPLLVVCVWWSLFEWSRGRDGRASLAAALAFLAKGPVAALHLVPLALALAPLRPEGARKSAGRVALGAALAALPLAGWALATASLGGDAYAHDLLVDQTRGRLSDSFAHARSALFYLPVLLVGLLPATPLFLLARPRGLSRRLAWAVGAVVMVFSAISGKQPHYLLPLLPAFALWAAGVLQHDAGKLRLLRLTAVGTVGIVLAAWVGASLLARGGLVEHYGEPALALFASTVWWAGWTGGVALTGLALWRLARGPESAPRVAALLLVGLAGVALPAQLALGRLDAPRHLGAALRAEPDTPLATYRFFQADYSGWLARRDRVDRLESLEALERWCAEHPGGRVVVPARHADEITALPLETELEDRVRGHPVRLERVLPPDSLRSVHVGRR